MPGRLDGWRASAKPLTGKNQREPTGSSSAGLALIFGAMEDIFLAVPALDRKAKARPADRDIGPAADAARFQELRRAEEHKSELQSLMRSSYAVFSLTTKNKPNDKHTN